MVIKRNIAVLFFVLCFQFVYAQHQEVGEKPEIWNLALTDSTESKNLLQAFKNGKTQGHVRYVFSSTTNKGALSDYYANAIGGGLRYETGSFHNFKAVISGFYIFNLGSSANIAEKDPLTGADSRYEYGLFDITGKESIKEINRLEEFNLSYSYGGLNLTYGRQLLNTPFINLQDGRMRPTVVEGLWANYKHNANHQFQAGYIYKVSPRSTVDWYDLKSSLGIYSVGRDASGAKSDYKGHTNSIGVFMGNYTWNASSALKIQAWDILFENVFNTAMIQGDYQHALERSRLYSGLQLALQSKVGQGGNENEAWAYYTNKKLVWILGARLGLKNSKWDYSLNFNRISSGGRYLMPREWGRDYFYAFMLRERTEGAGDVTSINLKSSFNLNASSQLNLAAGYISMPDTKNYYLNKYAVPSYAHFVFDFKHKFKGIFQGTESQVLYVFKPSIGEYYDNLSSLFNKVDMHLFTIVVNFRF
ncbi:MAG: OprD family outer membrane porin [Chitinophagales bacterium]|nr:OprD family outer membrane porin [Chitinophagales bacterium]